jgi:hypothetical protein
MGRYQWHIGGRSQDAVDAVITTLRETVNA